MYQYLYDYAVAHKLTGVPNRSKKSIAGYIVLDENGNFQQIMVVPKEEREEVLCPDIGPLAFGNRVPPICGRSLVILPGTAVKDNEITKAASQHDNWLSIMKEGAEHVEVLRVINDFLQKLEANTALMQQVCEECKDAGIKPTETLSFIVGSDRVELLDDWHEWFDAWIATNEKENGNEVRISCITGKPVVAMTQSFPGMKGGKFGTGAYMMSYDTGLSAYRTYGIMDNTGTPVSKEEVMAINGAIEHLLKSDHNHNDLFGIMYWYEHPVDTGFEDYVSMAVSRDGLSEQVLSESAKRKEMRAEKAFTGELNRFVVTADERVARNSKYKGTQCCVMRFNIPSKGRFWIAERRLVPYDALTDAVDQWLADTALEDVLFEKQGNKWHYVGTTTKSINSLYVVLYGLVHDKKSKSLSEKIKKEFGNDRYRLLQAMMTGKQIPKQFFERALHQLDCNMVKGEEANNLLYAQVIKVYLLRSNRKEYMDMCETLNVDATHSAYHLGRLLAVIEKMQKDSCEPGKEPTITLGNSYYRALKEDPKRMEQLIDKVQRAYIPKMRRRKKFATAVYYDQLLGEIQPKMAGLTKRLTPEERGLYDLGYRQQKMALYSRKSADLEDVEEEIEETEEQ